MFRFRIYSEGEPTEPDGGLDAEIGRNSAWRRASMA